MNVFGKSFLILGWNKASFSPNSGLEILDVRIVALRQILCRFVKFYFGFVFLLMIIPNSSVFFQAHFLP